MRLPKAGTIEISPSILSADFARLADEIKEVESAGLNLIHLDVMDAHFVPNLTFGPPVVAKLRKYSPLVFDSHLMMTQPDRYIDAFIKAGSDHITVHIESDIDHQAVIQSIRDQGCTAGISLNPDTPVSAIEQVAPNCDMVLVMTVHPGFGGQSFIEYAAEKIPAIRELVGPDVRIEVDGGVDPTTAKHIVSLGADTLVAGNAVFGKEDRKAAICGILDAAVSGKE